MFFSVLLSIASFLGVFATPLTYCQLSDGTSNRVVGGSDIPLGEYVPYQVSLQYATSRGQLHFCGGSIIAPDQVLTAAHCCQNLNTSRMSIVAGIRNLDDIYGFRSQVLSYVIHPDYQELVTSDIAILRISPPLELNNKTIGLIDFSGKEFVGGDVKVTLTGWGLRFPVPLPFLDNINYPNTMQRMSYNTITNEECRASGMEDVSETEICARGTFRGACSGDSGGPLVMSTPNGLMQIGVVSYGLAVCALYLSPDVYTRVFTFNDWIVNEIKARGLSAFE